MMQTIAEICAYLGGALFGWMAMAVIAELIHTGSFSVADGEPWSWWQVAILLIVILGFLIALAPAMFPAKGAA